jgi:signal transduction histidine kinase
LPEIVWYRSLYWRIALGFVALLATLLAVQGLMFLWLTGRGTEFLPGRSPGEYAQTIAADLATSLAEHPDLDIDTYLNDRYTSTYRAFVVAMRDGRNASSRRVRPPFELSRAAYGRLMGRGPGWPGGPGGPGGGPGPGGPRPGPGPYGRGDNRPPDGPPPDGRAPDMRPDRGDFDRGGDNRPDGQGRGRGGPGRGGRGGGPIMAVFAPVLINDEVVAMVAVPNDPPPLSVLLRDIGPTLGIVAVCLLIVGTSTAALLIFRPTHSRLKSLQDAARAIGGGEADARAPEVGGDEVTMLAHTFNEMAAGLEQRTQQLVAADESRRRLLADVSHELMTPLAAIRGYVETMAMPDLKLQDATRTRYLQIVTDETERMEHIIGDLLDLARVEGGAGEWRRDPVQVAALFERVQQRHDPALTRKRIALECEIAPDVHAIVGDANRLEQAIQNLAANAVRHTPEGGRIRLTADRVPGGVRLGVEDSGPGIPPEHLPRIFDRFYKVDLSRTGTALPSGSGLGLSIVQAIVKRHGGTIEAANSAAGGARFEMVLPDETAQPQ